MKHLNNFPLELVFWLTALILLAAADTHSHHFTLCPLANLGYEGWCPGCGLGRSISHLFHGEFTESFKQHWFGIPAFIIIVCRIYTLINKNTTFKILIKKI